MEEISKADFVFRPCTALSVEKNFLDDYEPEKSEIADLKRLISESKDDISLFFVGNLSLEFSQKLQSIKKIIFGRKDKADEFEDVSSTFGCIVSKEESYLVDYNNTYVLLDYTNFLEDSTLNFSVEFTLCSGKTYVLTFQFDEISSGEYEIVSEIITVKFAVIDQAVSDIYSLSFFFPLNVDSIFKSFKLIRLF